VEQVPQARKMYDARELTVEQVGAVLGVSRTSIYRALGTTTPPASPAAARPARTEPKVATTTSGARSRRSWCRPPRLILSTGR